ncbi:hypothetical protein BDAP_000023 [Binucleata daphniae]
MLTKNYIDNYAIENVNEYQNNNNQVIITRLDEFEKYCIIAQQHIIIDLTNLVDINNSFNDYIQNLSIYMDIILYVVETSTYNFVKKQVNDTKTYDEYFYTITSQQNDTINSTKVRNKNNSFGSNPKINNCKGNLDIKDYCKTQILQYSQIKNIAICMLQPHNQNDCTKEIKKIENQFDNLTIYDFMDNIEGIYESYLNKIENEDIINVIAKKNEFCDFLFTFWTGAMMVKHRFFYVKKCLDVHQSLTPSLVTYIKKTILKIDILCCFIECSIYMKDECINYETYNNTNYYEPNHFSNIYNENSIPQNYINQTSF